MRHAIRTVCLLAVAGCTSELPPLDSSATPALRGTPQLRLERLRPVVRPAVVALAPTITTFAVDPPAFSGSSTTVTVTFATQRASTTELRVDGVPRAGFPTGPSGQLSFAVQATSSLELVARGPGGVVTRRAEVAQLSDETELNDSAPTANLVTLSNGRAVVRAIWDSNDPADRFELDVPAGRYLEVHATVGDLSRCPRDAPGYSIELRGPGLSTSLEPAQSTRMHCAMAGPTTQSSPPLPGGRYAITVRMADAGPYYLHIRTFAPSCGDGVLELNEPCDDGNTVSGDGCSATCGFEPEPAVTAPISTVISGVLAAGDHLDAVRLAVTSTSVLFWAQVWRDRAAFSCPSDGYSIRLLDGAFQPIPGTPHLHGATCLGFDLARSYSLLAPGVYWLAIGRPRPSSNFPMPYQLELVALPPGVCGNHLAERNEECDGESYCSSTCRYQPIASLRGPTNEVRAIARDVQFVDVDLTSAGTIYAGITPIEALVNWYVTVEDRWGLITYASHYRGAAAPQLAAGSYRVRFQGDRYRQYEARVIAHGGSYCSDGLRNAGETCDDGNLISGDGCSATCSVEPGAGDAGVADAGARRDAGVGPGDASAPDAHITAPERCANLDDDDGDGLADCADPECTGLAECTDTPVGPGGSCANPGSNASVVNAYAACNEDSDCNDCFVCRDFGDHGQCGEMDARADYPWGSAVRCAAFSSGCNCGRPYTFPCNDGSQLCPTNTDRRYCGPNSPCTRLDEIACLRLAECEYVRETRSLTNGAPYLVAYCAPVGWRVRTGFE